MTEDNAKTKQKLTFSQRHGYEDLPKPMQLEIFSEDLRYDVRILICNNLKNFNQQFGYNDDDDDGYELVKRRLGKYYKHTAKKIDESYLIGYIDLVEKTMEAEEFNKVLDLIEHIVNDKSNNILKINVSDIANLFDEYQSTYRLDASKKPYWFYPISSSEQAKASAHAMKTISDAGMGEVRGHFIAAVEFINNKKYGDSVVKSILALESAVLTISPKDSTLGKGLNSLEGISFIESNLKKSFEQLYAYSNYIKDGRHGKPDKESTSADAPSADIDEAMLIFGACASFAAYLINKNNKRQNK